MFKIKTIRILSPVVPKLRMALLALGVGAIISSCGGQTDAQYLTGEISFTGTKHIIYYATLHIKILGSDPNSQLITEYVEPNIIMEPSKKNAFHAFGMRLPSLLKGETYSVEAHVDVDLDGLISPVDLTSYGVTFVAKNNLEPLIFQVYNQSEFAESGKKLLPQ